MTVQAYPWEATLIAWAQNALHPGPQGEQVQATDDALQAAYQVCEDITRVHSRTFFMASGLLAPEKRRAARALYAFCRVTDDLVDEDGGDRTAALDDWRVTLNSAPRADEPVPLAWADARARFSIPPGCVEQLICGVSRDLVQQRYHTFDELAGYAYGVASTVGLMAMHIIGYESEAAIPFAVKLGVALQITNILRDVGEDWRAGRLYLPLEELEAFGLTEDDLPARRGDRRWAAFMRFQIERNRRLYEEAMPGIAMLSPDGRFAIAAAAGLYRAILDDIERSDYDVFGRRAHVGALGKLRRLPAIWWRSQARPLPAPSGLAGLSATAGRDI